MKSLMFIAAVTTLVAARPELYKEKEDFQFSRSSTDEGSKSGYYGAQRGNMGGNYEKAHNMDNLAQHQMSGLIQQTEGELGDAAKMRTGSVFTAANSRGTYGSGRYNLNNLDGRNFQEGVSYDGSQSESSQRNSAFRQISSGSNRYNNDYSHSSGQSSSQQYGHQGHEMQSSNLQDELYRQQEHSGYSGTSGLSHMYQNRLVNTRPVRIMVRPGTRLSVPVATQTYVAGDKASMYDYSAYNQNAAKSDFTQMYNADRRSSSDSASYDHNAAKSDAEVIINNEQGTNSRYPSDHMNKQYEQSYSYRKEWEKHDTSSVVTPLSIPTESSLHEGRQLYDNSQDYNTRNHYQRNKADSQRAEYNSNVKSASASQERYRSNHNSQQESLSSDHYGSHLSGSNNDYMRQLANTQTANSNSKPQSYQSSYSYHKSWERQGDPYIIDPVPSDNENRHASQRMTSNAHDAHSSHHYGSQHKQSYRGYTKSNGLDANCEDEDHIRVARSYTADEFYAQENRQTQNGWENLGQQFQNPWQNSEVIIPGQENQNEMNAQENQYTQKSQDNLDQVINPYHQNQNNWSNLKDLGQQTQSSWDKVDDLGQQSQNTWDKIEDLGQQTQNSWDKGEDLGQQTQNKWDKLEDLGQQQQNKWDKTEYFGQQTQNSWDKMEDLGQQSQSKWDNLEDLGQQTQNKWDKIEDLGQQTQNSWDKVEDLSQQTQNKWNQNENHGQQSQTQLDQLNNGSDYQSSSDQHKWDLMKQSEIYTNPNNFGPGKSDQQFEDNWDLRDQIPQNPDGFQPHNTNDQETITGTDTSRTTQNFKKEDHSTNLWDKIDTFESLLDNQYFNSETLNSNSKNYRNNTIFGQDTNTDWNNKTQQQNNNNQYNSNSQLDSTYSNKTWHDSSSLNSFWNKINSFEYELPMPHNNGDEHSIGTEITINNFTNSNQDKKYQGQNKLHSANDTNQHNQFTITNTGNRSNDMNSETTSTEIKKNDDDNLVSSPRDVGRGDIGSDDFNKETVSITTEINDIHNNFNAFDINNNKYKTPEQIEALSLIKDNNVSDATVLGSSNKTVHTADLDDPIELSNQAEKTSKNNSFELEQSADEINQQLLDQQQHTEYLQDVHSQQKKIEENRNFYQQNEKQNLGEFEQYGQNINQQDLDELELYSQDKHQQNIMRQLEDFGQHSPELIQQNIEGNLEDFGQHSQYLHQQYIEQNSDDFSHHSQESHEKNTEQNFEDFGQHSQSMDQQTLENFGQYNHDFSQLNSASFDQHRQNFDKETIHKIENKDLDAKSFRNYYKNEVVTEKILVDQSNRNLDQFNIPHNQPQKLQNLNNPKSYSFDYNKQDDPEVTEKSKSATTQLITENFVSSTTAPVTEKPGFWASVGNKLNRAKSKVASWFRSS